MSSLIGKDSGLARYAEQAGVSAQGSIDSLTSKLANGNLLNLASRPHGLAIVRMFLWLALLFPSVTQAARLPLKAYTTADGLAHNKINKIVRDRRGFLWFCTAEGLSRFDGYTFTNFGIEHGLPHRVVTDLLETRSGEYWVATHAGLARLNPRPRPGAPFFTRVGAPVSVTSMHE